MTAALLAARGMTLRVLNNQTSVMLVLSALAFIAIYFPPAALGVGLIIWSRRDELALSAGKILAPDRTWYLWVPAAIILSFTWFKGGTVVPDDLNRHLTAYLHGYDYSNFYLYSDPRTPHASMWIGFEWLVGYLHRSLGLFWGGQLVQAIGFFWTIWLFTKLFLEALREHPERMLLTGMGVAAVLYSVLLSRVQAGRPEIFLSLLALTALVCNTRGKVVLWTLAMAAAQPLYWLALIYAPAALLLPNRSWLTRAAITAGLIGVALAFWLAYAGAEWYGFFPLLREWVANRAFLVGENNPIYHLLFVPGSLCLILIALLLPEREDWVANIPVLLVTGWFMVPNQVRYASVVSPLIALIAMRAVGRTSFDLKPVTRFMGVLVILSLMIGRMFGPGYDWLPEFKTLKGDEKVLTMFEASTFWLPAQYPGLKVAPAMEAGASAHELQQLIKDVIRDHTLDCAKLAKFPEITHVVDRNIETIPPCLKMQELHREWRLWRVAQ